MEVKTKSKKPQFVILTVVSMSDRSYGLNNYDIIPVEELSITLKNEKINLNNSILSYNKYGRITNPKINSWIQENNLHKTLEPLKLIFNLFREGNNHHYTLYETQANFLK